MGKVDWSIIISSHNSDSRIYTVVSTIDNVSSVTKSRGEVVIIDDCSETKLVKSKFVVKNVVVRILRNKKNYGQSKSENIGAINSHGKLLIFLNDDCVPKHRNFIKSTFELYKKGNLVIIGLITTKAKPELIESIRFPRNEVKIDRSSNISLQGGCFAIDRQLFIKIGGFSEDLAYFQDVELSYKLDSLNIKKILNTYLWAEHYDKKITLEKELKKTYLAYSSSFNKIIKRFPTKIKEFYWAEVFNRREQWLDKYLYSELLFIYIYFLYRKIFPFMPRIMSIEIYNYLQRCMIYYAIRKKEICKVRKIFE